MVSMRFGVGKCDWCDCDGVDVVVQPISLTKGLMTCKRCGPSNWHTAAEESKSAWLRGEEKSFELSQPISCSISQIELY
jgi:hypothetical protein